VKILPTLAVTAGLVVEDGGFFSLSQEGWQLVGLPPTTATAQRVKRRIAKRGRRTTVGKLVTRTTIAKRRNRTPPRTLSAEEQARAAERLEERTNAHQDLVARMAGHIAEGHGDLFEDEFSYDMLWVPDQAALPALLFEMKTIIGEADAHARVRGAVGQLSYYEYFHVAPRLDRRPVKRVIVVDGDVPTELREYLTQEGIGLILAKKSDNPVGLNPLGEKYLEMLPKN